MYKFPIDSIQTYLDYLHPAIENSKNGKMRIQTYLNCMPPRYLIN
jgi:hypothetical protein